MEPTWEEAKALLPIGMQVTGRVTDCPPFITFVDLGIGFVGFLRVTHLAESQMNPKDLQSPEIGSVITAWVIGYRDYKQQIELTQLPSTPEQLEAIRHFWAKR